MQPTKGARLRGGGSYSQKNKNHVCDYSTASENLRKKIKKKTFKNNCIYYRDIWRNTTHKEHNILGINIEQRVCAQSFAFLNKLLLVCGALTRNGEENFPMSAQPRKRIQRFRTEIEN